MRRTALALLLTVGLTVGAVGPVAAEPVVPEPPELPALAQLPEPAAEAAEEVLDSAEQTMQGQAAQTGAEPSAVLQDVFSALPQLSGEERRRARALLARPTDGRSDPNFDGYSRRERQNVASECNDRLCVQYVRVGDDRATAAWARTTLAELDAVWEHHIGGLGYREPVSDYPEQASEVNPEDTPQFDVYLVDTGDQGFYGYCAPERRPDPRRKLASGYCVLDNDFAWTQFGAPPSQTLAVTAAHEFFHAIQYAYDDTEDRWLLEATATWVEERYADAVDDNRQYLDEGQLRRPGTPLDAYSRYSLGQYGNWVFFEHLTERFGPDVVREVWERAGDFAGAPDQASVAAVRDALRARGVAFAPLFVQYAAANTAPAQFYDEGAAWRLRAPARRYRLSGDRSESPTVRGRLDHLTSRSLTVVRDDSLRRRDRLRVRIDGPRRRTGAIAHLLVHTDAGRERQRVVRLNRRGNAVRWVRFGRRVSHVTVTVANASTRYRCWQGTTFACQGLPRDDGRVYTVAVRAVR